MIDFETLQNYAAETGQRRILFILRYYNERRKKMYYYQKPGKFGLAGVFTDKNEATRLTMKEALEVKKKL